ncbi:MAG: hypothetical protein ACI8RD_009280 [Bacillariaceae sp.]|jgi:hypothetical protein
MYFLRSTSSLHNDEEEILHSLKKVINSDAKGSGEAVSVCVIIEGHLFHKYEWYVLSVLRRMCV